MDFTIQIVCADGRGSAALEPKQLLSPKRARKPSAVKRVSEASCGIIECAPVRLYRWRRKRSQHGNFGDEITIPILDRIFGVEALPVDLKDAELLGAGSTLEFYVRKMGRPPAWKKFLWRSDLHVWGTGTLFDKHEIGWPQRLQFHALRGSLTAQRVGINDIALGDPGILSGRLIRRPKKQAPWRRFHIFLIKDG